MGMDQVLTWGKGSKRGGGGGGCGKARQQQKPPGCFSGMLQLLEFHRRLRFTYPRQHFSPPTTPPRPSFQEQDSPLRVIEAPRKNNKEVNVKRATALKSTKERLVARELLVEVAPTARRKNDAMELETPRTPSVVARLMGLDPVPDVKVADSRRYSFPPPAPLNNSGHQTQRRRRKQGNGGGCGARESPPPLAARRPLRPRDANVPLQFLLDPIYDDRIGSRSLPDTPRSSSARRSWEADPRLSLQIESYEEAMLEFERLCEIVSHDYSFHSPSSSRKERRNPPQQRNKYTNQSTRDPAKKAKENADQKKPVDPDRGKENASLPAKSKRNSTTTSRENQTVPPPKPNSSPRVSFRDPCYEDLSTKNEEPVKCKKPCTDRYTEVRRKPSPAIAREETVDLGVPTPAPVPPKSYAQIPKRTAEGQKGVPALFSSRTRTAPIRHDRAAPLLPQCMKSAIKQYSCRVDPSPRKKVPAPHWGGRQEWQYVKTVLHHAGVRSGTSIRSARWHSPSHPIDPIIFHKIELAIPDDDGDDRDSRRRCRELGALKHRCNRKLLFQLVDELLRDILGPHLNVHPWRMSLLHPTASDGSWYGMAMNGRTLMRRLWGRIRGHVDAECRGVEGVEETVRADVSDGEVRRVLLQQAVGDEFERIVIEIERGIFQSLVREVSAELLCARR